MFEKMKKVIIILSSVLISILFIACGRSGNDIPEIKLIPVKSGYYFEYIDREGRTVISPQFNQATVFRNGLALVETSDYKWGFIKEDGKIAIIANYKEATVFSEHIAWVVSENEPPAAIDTEGKIKITLQDAHTVRVFREGLAAFSIIDTTGKENWGFVDKEGNIKIKHQFSSVSNFSNGKCAVKNRDGKWGYIDKEGKMIINYQFDGAGKFVNGKAYVLLGDKVGVIDESGKYIINPQFEEVSYDGDMFLIKKDYKWGWCDKDGKIIINPQFREAKPFLGNKLAAVKLGERYGYINKEGKIVINPQFDNAFPFNGEIALTVTDDKVGFIEKEGKYVINPQFDDASKDFVVCIFDGSSEFESVQTDYFNVAGIIDKIKKNITENTVAGMNFETPISTIMSKYAKSKKDFDIDTVHKITSEKITTDATLNLYILGNPWRMNHDRYDNTIRFDENFTPTGYMYKIDLIKKRKDKEEEVFRAIQNAFSDYTKVVETDDNIILKSNFQTIRITRKYGISIVVEPSASLTEQNAQNSP